MIKSNFKLIINSHRLCATEVYITQKPAVADMSSRIYCTNTDLSVKILNEKFVFKEKIIL